MDYEQDLKIQQDALDVEWLQQADLMRQYGQHAAQMRLDMDKAAETLAVVKAETDKEIRAAPADYDIVKITETVITNTIILEVGYRDALDKFNEARYEHEMARVAVSALEHKKSALENLIRLHGQQYFAGPSVPRDLDKAWEDREQQKESDKRVACKMQRRRRKN